ncbi:hypothetical protein T440DRAFT_309050 [Plenodomus tracheiphilus IPT5]|uniref:Uncharacterized protein n=1 Tax=Plenodomus tracheiphilus IPT5 TaxID=1408161 RepID=A0A6A7BGL3_9PLEO|nr:hypothetical protein T440DRAFT_309050 [Plenodomus tracheiphilus IPT5]
MFSSDRRAFGMRRLRMPGSWFGLVDQRLRIVERSRHVGTSAWFFSRNVPTDVVSAGKRRLSGTVRMLLVEVSQFTTFNTFLPLDLLVGDGGSCARHYGTEAVWIELRRECAQAESPKEAARGIAGDIAHPADPNLGVSTFGLHLHVPTAKRRSL